MATCAAFGGRDSGVPMLLGAAAFAALESDVYHHTLPARPQVEFARINGSHRTCIGHCLSFVTLGSNRALSRRFLLFAADSFCAPPRKRADVEASREVKRIPQALQFAIVIKRAGPDSMKSKALQKSD